MVNVPSACASTPSPCSASNSSPISPTISSRTSSSVQMPMTPPYSSTTTAMWMWRRCISRRERAHHLVEALPVHRQAGVPLLGEQAQDLGDRRVDVDRDHLGARHH